MKQVNEILKDIKSGTLKPLYVLDGEESYYIDLITDAFEKNVLEPHEKDFNFKVFYGKDTEWASIVNECRSYPAFAARRLVILKEAAQMKTFPELESYFLNPASTTILVIAYKHKKLDARTTATKAIKKNAVYATFDKIKDYHLSDWILTYCQSKKLKISAKNADLLATYLGTDLQKIVNELEKVQINISEGTEISEELIERYIGISKDYNVFQYPQAILEKNAEKAFRISNYFIANPKEAPMVVVTGTLYNEFCKLFVYHYAQHLPQKDIAAAMKINAYFVKDYQKAAMSFNLAKTNEAICIIQEYNLHAIGINIAYQDLTILKELTAKLLSL